MDKELLQKIYYEEFWENYKKLTDIPSIKIVDAILKVCSPLSVIDYGCGTGYFIREFIKHGINDVKGVDGPHIDDNMLVIGEKEKIIRHDITKPLDLGRKYDIALMLEVAEHIPSEFEDILFNTLFTFSNTIVFSSVNNPMSGTHHVNCHPEEYWDNKFIKANYKKYDYIRPLISGDDDIPPYYRENIIIYAKDEGIVLYGRMFNE